MPTTVKTFRAPDAAAALAAVKAELGPDAVLIATRTVPGGLFRRAEVEVTAGLGMAVPEPPGPAAAVPAPASGPGYARRAPAASRRGGDDPLAAEVHELRREVEEARRELARMALPAAAAGLHGRLLSRGVEAVLAEELVRQALVVTATGGSAERAVRELLADRLVSCRAPWMQPAPAILALVGPTGVGKTTTLAKIAARALLESRKRVALLSVDTYRIGAPDQLARYGEILGVPALVARDRGELLAAWRRVSGSDLVLVDTAGRSSPDDVARQAALVRAIPGLQLHLVLSAATGARQLAATADAYRGLAPDRMVFSKLDEAAAPGAILSAAVRLRCPVSCVTDGQRVPEDLHARSGPELVELVLPRRAAAGEGE